ncbi:MAG: FAD-binding oxidoreductase [Acidobacteriota bacterium]
MPTHLVQSRALPRVAAPPVETDPGVLARVAEDAAHYPGGRPAGLVRPRDAAEVAAVLALGRPVLAVGAQSSLTGGATPFDDLVLATDRLAGIELGDTTVRAGAGVTLQALQDALAPHGLWFPPVPTWLGATVGGAVSTNAAGAATFKYGAVRAWVEGLTIVLADGRALDLRRGDVQAAADGFVLESPDGARAIPIAPLPMPDVPKRSAGYHLAAGMDLVDLFIGAEGTLGVVVDATLRVAPRPAARCLALVALPGEDAAIRLVDDLRRASRTTWATGDPRGVDVAAIEHMDRRAIEIVREDGVLARLAIALPDDVEVVLLVEVELGPLEAGRDLWDEAAGALAPEAPDGSLARLCRLLAAHGVLETTELALAGQARRAAAFVELREAVPDSVNRRVARARARVDARITKTAADVVVPVDRFGDLMVRCRALAAARGLDMAVWGHISDGNVHPNVIPRSYDDVISGREAIVELGRAAIALGGCPFAEHGVGRNPAKQALLVELYGDNGVAAMRAVKRALDPASLLARGVLFPPE